MENITMLKVADIKSHPDNPRKDLGDLTELTESIRKNGIMQNLTVTPSLKEGKYIALIGHRRLAAAKAAGVKEVPCKIVEGLEKKDQVAIMLEENMQRNDLTITEQAFGFQMMLDLGETEKSIAEKTGFSRSTVRSRLSIAKLDPKLVKQATEDYQITLTDLQELQKIKDTERRNKVLEGVGDKWTLIRRVNEAIREEKQAAALKKLEPTFKELKIKKGTGQNEYKSWVPACKKIWSADLDKLPKEITIEAVKDRPMFYSIDRWNGQITVYYYTEEKATKREEEDEAKKERERQNETRDKIDALIDELLEQEKEFIQSVVDGRIKAEDNDVTWRALWGVIEEVFERYYFAEDFMDGEEKKAITKPFHRALMCCHVSLADTNIRSWNNSYDENKGLAHFTFMQILKSFGFSISGDNAEEIVKLLNGTSKLYAKEDE